ncbi:MAG TPA: ABC transporter permease [Blastocatellia bacterium]|nr:ABC transporter permease [Blastocatellia bacterium]
MGTSIQDMRYGLRLLLKQPGFTFVAIITLALGIGANTAIFSVVNGVLLRPLPYRDADRIAVIQEVNKEGRRGQVTPANFVDWRNQNTVFEHLAAIFQRSSNLAGTDDAERINLAMTSANFFDVFGVQPERGRLFIPEDEQAGHPAIVVISHGLWQRRYGSDPEIVGRSLLLDGRSYTVTGVAPAGFQYPDKTDAWVPPFKLVPTISETMDVNRARGFGFLSTVALLKPNVTLEQAKAEMESITARLREQYPETNNNRFDRVVSLHTNLVGDTSTILWLLLGAVGFVLLIACANVANLMLVRATSRQKEIAIRTAMGASRWRIMRQLLTESLILALTGGALGLLLALWGVDLLTRLLPKDFPRLADINLDFGVLAFTLLVSVITGVVFGFAPAWQVSRINLQESLKDSARGSTGVRNRLRSVFVVAEVMLSLVLLVGAGLLFRSFMRLQAVDAGFNAQQVLTLRLSPSGLNFRQDPQFVAYFQQVEERLRTIPGVQEVGLINTLPLAKGPTSAFRIEGRAPLPIDQWPSVNYRSVSPDYFRALNIPILQGRSFDSRDNFSVPMVVMINQATADLDFPGENPVGKRINMGGTDANNQPFWMQIVGVAANVRSIELQEAPTPEVYTCALQDPFSTMSVVIRTTVEPTAIAATLRETAQAVDKAQPVSDVRTMENIVSEAVTQPRFNLILLAIFGGIALVLSASGIYGVMAYTVTQRTHEIGIRMALGARGGDVLRMVMGQGLRLTATGIGCGLLASLLLTRYLSSLLFGVSATDVVTFAVVAVFLAGVALVACFVPARRAAKTDPMVALRYE